MSDYKELIAKLKGCWRADDAFKLCINAADAIEQLVKERDTAVIDAEPVRHGHWIHVTHDDGDGLGEYQTHNCSVCHKPFFWGAKNYCSWCGAKMDEEDNNEIDWSDN